MIQLLGLVLISFAFTAFLLVPFIDLLYFLRKRYQRSLFLYNGKNKKSTNSALSYNTPIHDQILKGKDIEVPVGGGLLIIPLLISISFLVLYFTDYSVTLEIYVLIFTLLSFGLIGLPDDMKKIFTKFSGKYSGMKSHHIFSLQIIFAVFIALMLYFSIGLNNIFVPFFGNIILGWWYIPLAILVIVSFANAYNISDGLDGLSSGLLTICLFAFLVLAHTVFDESLSVFVGVWIGALIAYLYFNVFPARIYLGDAGAFGFGATLAVVGLLTGKIIGLAVIGGVYVVIVASSLLQILSKKILQRKIMPVAPIHMYFKYIGWEEPKIVVRFWLAGAIFAILGLWLALLPN